MQELTFGNSKPFAECVERADRYSSHAWPLLILGETGVGKELIARRVHERSPRASHLFLPVNCAAIPGALFESELFGYEKGAFSGATQSTRGIFRQAHLGTLFLDEVGELDLSLQGKLLRLLDSGEVRSVGATRVESMDVRILAATNIDLPHAVSKGKFRQDLLERLSVLSLTLPPLRERREDIVPIAQSLLKRLNARAEEGALMPLLEYEWPGNIRQLRNLLIRTTVMGDSIVSRPLILSVLAEERARRAGVAKRDNEVLQGSLAEIEKQVIVEKLKQCHGNRKQTAEELGIAKSTLHEKMRKWKEEGTQFVQPLNRFCPMASLGG